jgi:hypothetical protein
MIPASVPLILVAVVCLAIGLVRGSSSLLIASIVASLLAAVALVIGARQRPATRHPAAPESSDDFEPPPPPRTTGAPSDAHDSAPAGGAFAADSGFAGESADAPFAPGAARAGESFASGPSRAGEPFAADSSEAAEYSAAAGRTDPIGFPAASVEPVYEDQPPADQGETADLPRTPDSGPRTPDSGPGAPAAGTHLTDETPAGADYRAASSTIGGARGGDADDQSWRRPAAPAEPSGRAEAAWAESSAAGRDSDGGEPATAGHGGPGRGFPAQASPGHSGPGPSGSDSMIDSAGPDSSALGDEFGEPDADDPDDEPLPQSVRPTDAVQVARLDTEVLVVDGRPRYHMADCPHLVGRLTEPLPAAEAVELGFSPCGLCRPVDRLLGANVHH